MKYILPFLIVLAAIGIYKLNSSHVIQSMLPMDNAALSISPRTGSSTLLSPIRAVTSSTTPLTSCGQITKPGSYILMNDIAAPQWTNCLYVHDTSNVSINCNNHAVTGESAIVINRVNGFKVSSCTTNTVSNFISSLLVIKSSNGEINKNTINKYSGLIEDSSNINFINNKVNAALQIHHGTSTVIKNNIFKAYIDSAHPTVSAVIEASYGSGNKIQNNRIDGNTDQTATFSGTDDGILIGDESDDVIQNNSINNNYDCGIENTGLIVNARIESNSITNAHVCGIGGWYWSGWKDSLIQRNTVTNSAMLFYFSHEYGLRPAYKSGGQFDVAADQYVYFTGNTFNHNSLINISANRYGFSASSYFTPNAPVDRLNLPGETYPTPDQYIVSNNTFTKNYFNNTIPAPQFLPNSLVVDGGGNVCGSHAVSYPLKCGTIDQTASTSAAVVAPAF